MKNNKLQLLVFSVLLISITFINIQLQNSKYKTRCSTQLYHDTLDSLKAIKEVIPFAMNPNSVTLLDTSILKLSNGNYESVLISELFNDSVNYVLRLSNTTCGSCIDDQINLIKNLKNKKLHVFSQTNNVRNLSVICSTNNINSPIYVLPKGLNIFEESYKYKLVIGTFNKNRQLINFIPIDMTSLWIFELLEF